MPVVTGLIAFVIIWCLVFFMVLPLGVHSPSEAGQQVEAGHDPGAPVRPRLLLKVGITTAVAVVLFICFLLLQAYDPFGFADWLRRY
ncbi:MAG TPA: DUF1467 family protein [Alphaproteobacteria bacterium]|nr:DUF1467 family protein [Alphaproteobacteria bacterium]